MAMLTRVNRFLEWAAAAITAVFMAAMTLIIFAQVIGRYLVHYSLPWSEELARFMLVWISMLGTAVGLRRGQHVGLTLVTGRLQPRARRALVAAGILFALLLLSILAYFGLKQALFNMRQRSPALDLPMGWPYLAIPVAAAIMVLSLVEELAALLGSNRAPAGFGLAPDAQEPGLRAYED